MTYRSVTLSGSEESFGADNCSDNVGRNEDIPRSERFFADAQNDGYWGCLTFIGRVAIAQEEQEQDSSNYTPMATQREMPGHSLSARTADELEGVRRGAGVVVELVAAEQDRAAHRDAEDQPQPDHRGEHR